MTTEPMDDEDDKGRAADDGYSVPDLPAGERLDDFYTDDAILAIPGIKVTREVDSFWATLGDTPKAFGVVLLGFVSLPCIMIAAVPLLALAVFDTTHFLIDRETLAKTQWWHQAAIVIGCELCC